MMSLSRFWIFTVVIALGHCRPKLDRDEERNEELSGPDVVFAYHNPPNGDDIVREEETEDSAHRLSKRLAENDEQDKSSLSQDTLVYLKPIFIVDDKAYLDLIKRSKSLEEQQYVNSNGDDLDVAAAIVYRPLFVYRLQKSKRLNRRRNSRSIHSTLPVDSKSKYLYRTDNDLMSKVILIFLPVYNYPYDNIKPLKSVDDTIKIADRKPEKQEKDKYYQQNNNSNDFLIVQPSNFIDVSEENEDGDPLQAAESSVVHPLFLYRYRVAYYKRKDEREEKERQKRQQ